MMVRRSLQAAFITLFGALLFGCTGDLSSDAPSLPGVAEDGKSFSPLSNAGGCGKEVLATLTYDSFSGTRWTHTAYRSEQCNPGKVMVSTIYSNPQSTPSIQYYVTPEGLAPGSYHKRLTGAHFPEADWAYEYIIVKHAWIGTKILVNTETYNQFGQVVHADEPHGVMDVGSSS